LKRQDIAGSHDLKTVTNQTPVQPGYVRERLSRPTNRGDSNAASMHRNVVEKVDDTSGSAEQTARTSAESHRLQAAPLDIDTSGLQAVTVTIDHESTSSKMSVNGSTARAVGTKRDRADDELVDTKSLQNYDTGHEQQAHDEGEGRARRGGRGGGRRLRAAHKMDITTNEPPVDARPRKRQCR
jgi:hypothetical protein